LNSVEPIFLNPGSSADSFFDFYFYFQSVERNNQIKDSFFKLLKMINPFYKSQEITSILSYSPVGTFEDQIKRRSTIEIGRQPEFYLYVFFPPTLYEVVNYMTLADFVSVMGGYFSSFKLFATLLISLFIFQELNTFMARRIFKK